MLWMMAEMKDADVSANNLFLKEKITKITSAGYMLPTGREGKLQTSVNQQQLGFSQTR